MSKLIDPQQKGRNQWKQVRRSQLHEGAFETKKARKMGELEREWRFNHAFRGFVIAGIVLFLLNIFLIYDKHYRDAMDAKEGFLPAKAELVRRP
jgi:hypothetical protein